MNIQALPFVHSTHDFHAFQVASDFPILIGHIIFDDPQNNYDYTRMLKDIKGECLKKGIDHVTLQLEPLNGVEQLDCSCPVHGPDDMCWRFEKEEKCWRENGWYGMYVVPVCMYVHVYEL